MLSALCLLLALPGAGVARWAPPCAAGPPARAEHFLVTRPDAAGDPLEVAVVALRRLERVDGWVLEREVVFREGGLRVHHVEVARGDARRLVWREWGGTAGRTWMADWSTAGGRVRTIGYGWSRPVHGRLVAGEGTIGPLEAFDRVRSGVALDHGVVAPRAGAIERWTGSSEVRRGDGSRALALELAPDGGGVAAWSWSDGPALARPIGAEDFHRRARRWGRTDPPHHPAVEAALRRDATVRRIGAELEAAGGMRLR